MRKIFKTNFVLGICEEICKKNLTYKYWLNTLYTNVHFFYTFICLLNF